MTAPLEPVSLSPSDPQLLMSAELLVDPRFAGGFLRKDEDHRNDTASSICMTARKGFNLQDETGWRLLVSWKSSACFL